MLTTEGRAFLYTVTLSCSSVSRGGGPEASASSTCSGRASLVSDGVGEGSALGEAERGKSDKKKRTPTKRMIRPRMRQSFMIHLPDLGFRLKPRSGARGPYGHEYLIFQARPERSASG